MALLFGSSDPKAAYQLGRDVAAKKVRKLAAKIYSDDLVTPDREIVRSHRFEIVAHFYPNAVVSHRTALNGGSISKGNRFHITVPGAAISSRPLPGFEIRIWPGPGVLSEDQAIPTAEGPIHIASRARALLENLLPGRARGKVAEAKTLTRAELEIWLERQIRISGRAELHRLLGEARIIAPRVKWEASLAKLEQLIADLDGVGNAGNLNAPVAIARAMRDPYDPERLALFTELQARLASESFISLPSAPAAERRNRAFWESYFSNYIEGTKFTVEDAQSIVEAADPRRILQQRPKEAHDILETYRLITDDRICRDVPQEAPGFFDVLKRRHARMMASRPEVQPGVFKVLPNQVGTKTFVAPDLVEGTLRRAWPQVRALTDPVARALLVHFVLAEVHPFSDGNGRISRLSMNAELDAAGRARILIPTCYRTDYLTVLDALTRGENPTPFIAFGHRILALNRATPYENPEITHDHFKKVGAMSEEPSGMNIAALAQI